MKQCVDPKLNSDYPPKAVAKVNKQEFFLRYVSKNFSAVCWICYRDLLAFSDFSAGSSCSVVRSVRIRLPTKHDHRGEGDHASSKRT